MKHNGVPAIGEDVMYEGKLVHVQDVDLLAMTAHVGEMDCNGMVWDKEEVEWKRLSIPVDKT